MDAVKRIGTNIKTMRLSRGLTQEDLAKKIGQSPSSITMYETGRRQPPYEVLEAIADVFNVSMQDIIGKPPKLGFPGQEREYLVLPEEDRKRLEALHQNPRLGMLFDKTTKMKPEDVDYMMRFADGILKEMDGE